MKTYIVGTHLKCLIEALLMRTHNMFSWRYKKNFITFCFTNVAWQTQRGHVVRLCHWRRQCHYHTFLFCSVKFEGRHWFHSNFAELYITVKYRLSSILIIIRQILAELWPFFDLVFVVCFRLVTFEGMHWFHSDFAKLYVTVKYRSNSILVIIHQIWLSYGPFLTFFVGVLILVSAH